MGTSLIEEVLDHAPADLTPAERMILVVLARHANTRTRECWPSPETIAAQAGVKPESVSKSLQRLARRGLELRVPVGKDKNGRPVFAHKGRKTTYRLPRFAQSQDESPAFEVEQSPDSNPAIDSKPGPQSDLQAPKGGQPSPKARTTVRQSPDHSPPLTLNEPSGNKEEASSAASVREITAAEKLEFGRFWHNHPKSKDYDKTLEAWSEAVRAGADPVTISAAALAYAREMAGQEFRFVKHSANWLRERRYEDKFAPEPDANGRPPLRAVSGGYQPYQQPSPEDYANDLGF